LDALASSPQSSLGIDHLAKTPEEYASAALRAVADYLRAARESAKVVAAAAQWRRAIAVDLISETAKAEDRLAAAVDDLSGRSR
jgi:hypothetical protein